MDLELNETQKLVRETARSFAREKVAPRAKLHDREERFPAEIYRQMGELGLLGVNVPPQLGGAGAGAVSYALAMMEISTACASTAVGMAVTNMCAELIAEAGTEAQRKKYVPRLASGEALVGAFALSEPHCGSDAAALRTRARRVGDRYVLDGSKQWVSSGAFAGVMVVWARTAPAGDSPRRGISCFIVEGNPPGLTVGKPEDKMGLRGSNTVPLTFEGCEVPAENLLGKEGDGFRLALLALQGGRIGIASQACGVARAALEASVAYSKQRTAFGQRLADFQALRFCMANIATELGAAELLTLRAAWLKEAGQRFVREASMAKLFASEMAQRACDKAVQIHGGYGYIDEFPVERYLRDARVQTIYEGTSEIQRMVIAREILKAAG
ncbi:MAG: acyl-CoA dehydrogenase family protein [Myxococcales bacterium]|nr:acyl-CoA dehydrogenase family protein [Myxococcales bacterium]